MSHKLEAVLAARGIAHRTSGKHELLVRCPMCGSADPSEHLSVSLVGRGWRCLRNPRAHKGKSYARLLTLILHCSEEDAREMLGQPRAVVLPAEDDFAQQWRKQLGVDTAEQRPASLRLPREFHALEPGAQRSQAFWRYLEGSERGFTQRQAEWAADAYHMYFAISGSQAYRVILPLYSRPGNLVSWTGRAIDRDADIRYLTLSTNPDKVKYPALAPTTQLLLGLPLLWGARETRCLVVCEGPFDAIAISVLGHKYGIWGTCLFGLELTLVQADLLAELSEVFDRMLLMIDSAAMLRVLEMRERLPRRCRPAKLPGGLKDPGELVKYPGGAEFVQSLAA